MRVYNPTDAGRRIQEFVGMLSNWYVRRSRRRFWKSENDEDKNSAYATLYNVFDDLEQAPGPFHALRGRGDVPEPGALRG